MHDLLIADPQKNQAALHRLAEEWHEGYRPMLIDALYMARGPVDRAGIVSLLQSKTGQNFGEDAFAWAEWQWNEEERKLPFHGDWMAWLYGKIDPKFTTYFAGRTDQSLIRLDEVLWGGVVQDGIPPLRQPEMIKAAAAAYLADSNIVFGVSINGDHRAYPKRILAWHEMFVDEIGG